MNAPISETHQASMRRSPHFAGSEAGSKSDAPAWRNLLFEAAPNRPSAVANTDDFVRAMRHLASSVTIVATGEAPQRSGMTATAVCSMTANPPQMLACLNGGSATSAAILHNGKFSINLLSNEDSALAARFAGRDGLAGEERFQDELWNIGKHGAPVLQKAIVSVECSVQQSIAVDTHVLIVGVVLDISGSNSFGPLIYGNGKFGGWAPISADRMFSSDDQCQR